MASSKRKNQQTIVIIAIVFVALIFAIGVMFLLTPKQTSAFSVDSENSVDMSIISDRTSAAAPEMTWITTSRGQIDELSEQMEEMRNNLSEQKKIYSKELGSLQEQYDEVLVQQALKIADLENKLSLTAPSSPQSVSGDPYAPDYSNTGNEFIQRRIDGGIQPKGSLAGARRANENNNSGVDEDNNSSQRSFGSSFTLASIDNTNENNRIRKSLKDYIPAGSYAPALVLSGADAATNVADRESPLPVLFRVTGQAITAMRNGVAGKVDIEGCTVQGSASGDLSSERVLVRLISITCLKGNDVIETAISGYMVGKGKSGVRGHVVSREGGLIASAAVAGALQGFAGAMENTASTADGAMGLADMATAAATAAGVGGVQEAASTLSDYLIERAEQYQPVVTLNSGSVVELVFLEGVSLK
jgi:conjugal transfer pilus assembly protein TraB